MHFHLPKPLHGWREFAGEVGIIVLGVLIALTAEALVEDIGWRGRVAEARQELRYELGQNVALLHDRLTEEQCVNHRLDELATIVTRASATGRLPPVGDIGFPSVYSWPDAVWQSQISAQTATHFPRRELGTIARVYRDFADLREENQRERVTWLTLRTITGPGRPVTPESIDRLIQAISEARGYNARFPVWAHVIVRLMNQGEIGSGFAQIDPKNPPVLNANEAICRTLGPAPPTYAG
ncbi:MAG: hypothetical protein HOP95_07115 [Sphingomonas sp.]|nr:hypothetical protein [Sphingomonas sp.]